ncbi:MAG: hypothetical protein KA264_00575 [Crocinitomicaceae bacterium]|nr:hypothetical protein [Crocinitomicaceae bacterium]
MHTQRHKNQKSSTLIKAGLLTSLLILTNVIWYIFFHYDKSLDLTFGIISPILYGLFYFFIKKIRKKSKSKIKSIIYIPISYSFFGIFWLIFSLGISKLTSVSDTSNVETEDVIEKLEIKNFFIFNPNLSFPSKISEEIERRVWNKSGYPSTIQQSKRQTNNLVLFIILFFIQMITIYLVENIIHPRIKPKQKKKMRSSNSRRPPRDTIISSEKDVFLNFSETKEKEEVKVDKEPIFPKL